MATWVKTSTEGRYRDLDNPYHFIGVAEVNGLWGVNIGYGSNVVDYLTLTLPSKSDAVAAVEELMDQVGNLSI